MSEKVKKGKQLEGGFEKIRRKNSGDGEPRGQKPSHRPRRVAERAEEEASPAVQQPPARPPQPQTRPVVAPVALNPPQAVSEERKGGNNVVTTAKTLQDLRQTTWQEKEPCPGCGNLKYKTITVKGETIRLLTCVSCSRDFEEYQAKEVAKMAEDPTAPEPMNKFEWLLSRNDLVQIGEKMARAIATYRKVYDEKVIANLRQRGYLNGEPQWAPGPWKRPFVSFTRESRELGEKLRDELERRIQEDFGQMKRAEGHLKAAAKFKAEQDERAAKKAETPATT